MITPEDKPEYDAEQSAALLDGEQPDHDGEQPVRKRAPRKPWTPKQRKRAAIWGSVIAVVLIVAGSIFGVYNSARQKELTAYGVLEQNECVADYEDYLKQYPDSKHSAEVRGRLETLKQMYRDWAKIVRNPSKKSFNDFKMKYPMSILLAHQANLKIDSLDWEEAKEIGSLEAYRHYLALHPSGLYAREASIESGLIDDATVRDEEKELIRDRVRAFFRAFSAGHDDEAMIYLSIPMREFIGSSGSLHRDEIIEEMHNYNGANVSSCNFAVGNDFGIQKSLDANGVPSYSASCSVDMHAVIAGVDAYTSYRAQMTLSSRYNITRLRLVEIARTNPEDE